MIESLSIRKRIIGGFLIMVAIIVILGAINTLLIFRSSQERSRILRSVAQQSGEPSTNAETSFLHAAREHVREDMIGPMLVNAALILLAVLVSAFLGIGISGSIVPKIKNLRKVAQEVAERLGRVDRERAGDAT